MGDEKKTILKVNKKENFSDQDKSGGKKPFLEPKLKYIKPKLIKYGKVDQLTTGPPPIGPFSPPPPDNPFNDPNDLNRNR